MTLYGKFLTIINIKYLKFILEVNLINGETKFAFIVHKLNSIMEKHL